MLNFNHISFDRFINIIKGNEIEKNDKPEIHDKGNFQLQKEELDVRNLLKDLKSIKQINEYEFKNTSIFLNFTYFNAFLSSVAPIPENDQEYENKVGTINLFNKCLCRMFYGNKIHELVKSNLIITKMKYQKKQIHLFSKGIISLVKDIFYFLKLGTLNLFSFIQ